MVSAVQASDTVVLLSITGFNTLLRFITGLTSA